MVRPCVSLKDRRGKPPNYTSEQSHPTGREMRGELLAYEMRIRSALNQKSRSGTLSALAHLGAEVILHSLALRTATWGNRSRVHHLDLFENRGSPNPLAGFHFHPAIPLAHTHSPEIQRPAVIDCFNFNNSKMWQDSSRKRRKRKINEFALVELRSSVALRNDYVLVASN